MRPSANPLWNRILLRMEVVMFTLVFALEVYLALGRPGYDIRTGNMGLVLVLLAARVAFPRRQDDGSRPAETRIDARLILSGVFLVAGTVLTFHRVFWPGPPSWLLSGVGLASLVCSIACARIRSAQGSNPKASVEST